MSFKKAIAGLFKTPPNPFLDWSIISKIGSFHRIIVVPSQGIAWRPPSRATTPYRANQNEWRKQTPPSFPIRLLKLNLGTKPKTKRSFNARLASYINTHVEHTGASHAPEPGRKFRHWYIVFKKPMLLIMSCWSPPRQISIATPLRPAWYPQISMSIRSHFWKATGSTVHVTNNNLWYV